LKALEFASSGPLSVRSVKRTLHGLASRVGLDVVPYANVQHFVGRRQRLFRALGIDLVFDVGANTGQYATELRRFGFRGQIVSFEPLSGPYATLSRKAAKDTAWLAVHSALGRTDGDQTIHVAANSHSSSFLEMLPLHEQAAPYARYVRTESVKVRRLDAVALPHLQGRGAPFLKIDAQGYESEILAGGTELVQHLVGLELELSLDHLYADDSLIDETIQRLKLHGFRLVDLRPGFADPVTGRLLQADGVFVRSLER
jgi:FkbM family methyltransferase